MNEFKPFGKASHQGTPVADEEAQAQSNLSGIVGYVCNVRPKEPRGHRYILISLFDWNHQNPGLLFHLFLLPVIDQANCYRPNYPASLVREKVG
jgi:hypothetical protein